MKDYSSIVIVILAAGASSRLGQPKQLLEFLGKPLLQHTIDEALKSRVESIVLVLGSHADQIQEAIQSEGLILGVNPNWNEGMASSIRFGLNLMTSKSETVQHVLFLLADQPFISNLLINQLVEKQLAEKSIVACDYGNQVGVPAIFSRNYFDELFELKGDRGAKKLFHKHSDNLQTIPFEKGIIDIDTLDDYRKLGNEQN